jgi:hypothetical protein
MSDYPLILRPLSSSTATGAKRSPFYSYISENGAGSVINLASDFSGVNSDASWIAPKDAVVTMLTIGVGDVSVAANASVSSRFVPDGSSSTINLAIRSGTTVIQDLFVNGVPALSLCALSCVSSGLTLAFTSEGGATPANNECIYCAYIDFVKKCGGGVYVDAGNNIGFPLASNWSTATNVLFAVSGYFVG